MNRHCDEATCVRRGPHDIHLNAAGRSWAFRDSRPEWRRRAEEALQTRGYVAVKATDAA